MTEADWLACDKRDPMLKVLSSKGTDRKWRLFGVACCRRIWDLVADARCRRAVETSEKHADGLASKKELTQARSEARAAGWNASAAAARQVSWDAPSFVAWCTTRPAIAAAACRAARTTHWLTSTKEVKLGNFIGREVGDLAGEEAKEANLIRDIFGNPFRTTRVTAEWLLWSGGTVVRIAQTIYDERAFDRLPILADALEDAGCDNADLLNHCRNEGPHVRGCWVVDLLLGKQ